MEELSFVQLEATLSRGDDLVARLVVGELGPDQFFNEYGSFFWEAALDGHEASDQTPFKLLASRIEPHRRIAEEVLSRLCSREDAARQIYIDAGRIGPSEAAARVREIWGDRPSGP